MYAAAYEKRGMRSPEDVEDAVSSAEQDVIPVGIAYVEYNEIDEDAYADYRIDIDPATEKIRRGSNPASPYNKRTFVAAGSLSPFVAGTNVTFDFDEQFYTTNMGENPQSLEVDFGDGMGFRQVSLGSRIGISYASAGTKDVRTRITFSSAVFESSFEVQIREALTQLNPDPELTNTNAEAQYEGERVGYEHYGFFGDGNTSLQKPVIFLDGIDFGDQIKGIDARGLEEIYGILNLHGDENGLERGAADALRDRGYDLFILNYKDGATNIRRNAFTLVDLLQFINQKTGGSKKITVIGPSMGGVVSRYALAYMEHEGIEHNVALFVSYDSPQQGANVPVGLQELVDEFPIPVGPIKDQRRQLERPAFRELAVYNAADGTGFNDPLRMALLTDLETYGDYPSQPRIVAVANGDGYGRKQVNEFGEPLGPGDRIFRLAILDSPFLPYEYETKSYAAPNKSRGIIYRTGHYLKVHILFLGEVRIKLAGIERRVDTPPFDSAPGGFRDFTKASLIAPDIETAINGMGGILDKLGAFIAALFVNTSTNFPNQSFIPTVSALDYSTSYPSGYDPYNQNLFYPVLDDFPDDWQNKTPFDNIFAHDGNTVHVGITRESFAFLLDEIFFAYREPYLALDGYVISDTRRFEAQESITAGPSFTVEADGDVALLAGETITLLPGFRAELGGAFYAEVDPSLGTPPSSPPGSPTLYVQSPTGDLEATRGRPSLQREREPTDGRSGTAEELAAAKQAQQAPIEFKLSQNYPNPFNPTTEIEFSLPKVADVSLVVYDMMGRQVARLVEERRPAGHHRLRWDASGFASGAYVYLLIAGDLAQTKTMVLLK